MPASLRAFCSACVGRIERKSACSWYRATICTYSVRPASGAHPVQFDAQLLLLAQLLAELLAQIRLRAIAALAAHALPQLRVSLVLLLQLRVGGLQARDVGGQLLDGALQDGRLGGVLRLQAIERLSNGIHTRKWLSCVECKSHRPQSQSEHNDECSEKLYRNEQVER